MNDTTFEGQRVDEALDCLTDRTRRDVLMMLRAAGDDEQFDVWTLVQNCDADEVSINHVHLPKLDGADLVRWDRESGVVERGALFTHVEPLLDVVEAEGWH